MTHALLVPYHAGDDRVWLEHSAAGLSRVWSAPSPFRHYRPVFGSWIWMQITVGAVSPGALGLGSMLLFACSGALAYWSFRFQSGSGIALITATVVCLHPAREQQMFWVSAGIDALCLCFSLVCLGLVARAFHRGRCGPLIAIQLFVATAMAALSKETALLLPGLILLWPVRSSRYVRAWCVVSSAAGGAFAALCGVAVLGGSGRIGGLLSTSGAPATLFYPSRLIWPGNLADWMMRAKLLGEPLPLVTAGLAGLAMTGWMLWVVRSRIEREWARTGLLLVFAGLLPWIVRQEDRGIGLGVAGLGLLLGGILTERGRNRRWLPATVLAVLALIWTPIWIQRHASWLRAAEISQRIARSVVGWRDQVGPDELLIAFGSPAKVDWTCDVLSASEVDPCSLGLLSLLGPGALEPLQLARHVRPDWIHATARGESVLRWSGPPLPSVGVMEVIRDESGYVRKAVVDPARWPALAELRSCRGYSFRVWDGTRFVRSELY